MQTTTAGERKSAFSKLTYHIVLLLGALLSIFPFYWMLVISTNDRSAAFHVPPILSVGDQFFQNFDRVLERIEFFEALGNSAFVSFATTISVLFFCSLAGFAFAKFQFPGKKWLFLIVLGTLLVPQQLSVLPNYVLMSKLGWIDSFKAIIVPGMVNAFGIFWMRQYIESAVHDEMIEAARVDGSGYFGIFLRMVLPVITPALATLGILTFMNVWNDFFWPLVVLKNESNFTIQIALQQLSSNRDGLDYGMIMSATFAATVPLIIVFLIFNRWFISGLTSGAVKS
ncbi:carbohydrate ABC transporter permease [Marinicrinis lubricantis]|uniref:Carbohydrate ABC transporter permease n=1 Tax=Marinicrinis lubricantis TaxID=2086470 RepID=A0ABW1IGZ2_9BACL